MFTCCENAYDPRVQPMPRALVNILRAANVDLLAIGQYLQPTKLKRHVPLVEYVTPDQFARYKDEGMRLGFKYVASGPLVRSSYKAWEAAMVLNDE